MTFDFLHAFLADISLPQLAGIALPIAAMVLAGVVVVSGLYFQHRRRHLWHETARLALEKGQPLPPLEDEAGAPASGRPGGESQNDFRVGLVLVATGAGLFLFLGNFIKRELGYVGAIPGFIGFALLLHGALNLIFRKKTQERPPQ